jgi:hypothetical protein
MINTEARHCGGRRRLWILLLLIAAASIAGIGAAMHWRRQHFVKITIKCPGLSVVVADDQIAVPYLEGAGSLPVDKIVAISSKGQTEVFFEEHGTDPAEILRRAKALATDKLPSNATVQEGEIGDTLTGIPDVDCQLVKLLDIEVIPERCARFHIPIAEVEKAATEKRGLLATPENSQLLASTIIQTDGPAGKNRTIYLRELARITVRTEPAHIVRQLPP